MGGVVVVNWVHFPNFVAIYLIANIINGNINECYESDHLVIFYNNVKYGCTNPFPASDTGTRNLKKHRISRVNPMK